MTLIRYQGQLVGFLGATRYTLIPELLQRPDDDRDLRRVAAVCDVALVVRWLTGAPPGYPLADPPPNRLDDV